MLFSVVFANNTILSYFFFFFLIIDLYFFNSSGYFLQTYNPIAELVISIEISTKERKAEMEIHPVTVEAKISKYPI